MDSEIFSGSGQSPELIGGKVGQLMRHMALLLGCTICIGVTASITYEKHPESPEPLNKETKTTLLDIPARYMWGWGPGVSGS